MTPLDQLSEDLGWRERELGSLKILLGRKDITAAQHTVLLRAAWAMLYAHYEGFVKYSLTVFYAEITKCVSNCETLPKETKVNALLPELKKLRTLPIAEFLDEIENFKDRYYLSSPIFSEVDTKSNLWPNVLLDLLRTADIDQEFVEEHKFKLKTLVARRNDIAHGKQSIIDEYSYYIEFESVVYDLMYKLAFLIDSRLNSAPYC